MNTNNTYPNSGITAFNEDIQEIIGAMISNREFRIAASRESFILFFGVYFGRFAKYPFADFHGEMFALAEDEKNRTIVIMAARGSAKSAIMNTALAIWSILGRHGKHCIVILSETQDKARKHFLNIKDELTENFLLKFDMGPLRSGESKWGPILTLPHYNAQITFASLEEGIRGLKYQEYRPDFIVADDIESENSVRTIEGRNKTYDQFVGNVIAAGEVATRIVLLGTMLHEDSVMMRFAREIKSGNRDGVYRRYPLMDDEGNILWKAKYPDMAAVEAQRKQIGNEVIFAQEFLLQILSGIHDVIDPAWIQIYDDHPPMDRAHEYRGTFISVDPAYSPADTACKTAVVAARVFGYGQDMQIYFLPNPVNERMSFMGTVDAIEALSSTYGDGDKATIYIEDNAAQRWLVELLQRHGYPAVGVHSASTKESRMLMASPSFKKKSIFLKRKGNEALYEQLVGFGTEHYNDLSDAAVMLIIEQEKANHPRPRPIPDNSSRNDDDDCHHPSEMGLRGNGQYMITRGIRNKMF